MPGFLKLFLCGSLYVCVFACVCVCVSLSVSVSLCLSLSLRLLITSGMIWTTYDWLNKFCSCYMVTVVVIVNGHSLSIDMHCGN